MRVRPSSTVTSIATSCRSSTPREAVGAPFRVRAGAASAPVVASRTAAGASPGEQRHGHVGAAEDGRETRGVERAAGGGGAAERGGGGVEGRLEGRAEVERTGGRGGEGVDELGADEDGDHGAGAARVEVRHGAGRPLGQVQRAGRDRGRDRQRERGRDERDGGLGGGRTAVEDAGGRHGAGRRSCSSVLLRG